MCQLKLFLVFFLASSTISQRKSLWKRYTHIPGKFNCVVDSLDYRRLTKEISSQKCVARIANDSNIYSGHLRPSLSGTIFFNGENNGNWFNTPDLSEVEVLDVDPVLRSWIPISLNPPDSILINAYEPFSSYPRRFICRYLPFTTQGFIASDLGFMQNGVCHTYWTNTSRGVDFEVLALNGQANFYYEYDFPSPNGAINQ